MQHLMKINYLNLKMNEEDEKTIENDDCYPA